MDKCTLLHPYDGILLNDVLVPDKEEWTIDTHNKMHKSKMYHAKWKKLDSNNIIWTTFWKGQNYRHKERISDCQELRAEGEGDSRETTWKLFRRDGLFCVLIMMVFKPIYILSKLRTVLPKRLNFTIYNFKNK